MSVTSPDPDRATGIVPFIVLLCNRQPSSALEFNGSGLFTVTILSPESPCDSERFNKDLATALLMDYYSQVLSTLSYSHVVPLPDVDVDEEGSPTRRPA